MVTSKKCTENGQWPDIILNPPGGILEMCKCSALSLPIEPVQTLVTTVKILANLFQFLFQFSFVVELLDVNVQLLSHLLELLMVFL